MRWLRVALILPMLVAAASWAAAQAPNLDFGSPQAAEAIGRQTARSKLGRQEDRRRAANPKDQKRLDDLLVKEKKTADELRALDSGLVTQDQVVRGIEDSRQPSSDREQYQESKRAEAKEKAIQRLRMKLADLQRQINAIPKAALPPTDWLHPARLEAGQRGTADWEVRVVEVVDESAMVLEVHSIHTDDAINLPYHDSPREVLLRDFSTNNMVDDKWFQLDMKLWVKGTEKYAGRTLFVLTPNGPDPDPVDQKKSKPSSLDKKEP